MKKLYSKSNLVKTVTLAATVATLLSTVSPVFAANIAIRGGVNESTGAATVPYVYGSHGSIVFAGDDDHCGVDNVVGRGGKQQKIIPDASRITVQEQYTRFITDQDYGGRHPYGTTTEQVIWNADSITDKNGGYMGALTGGIISALPEAFGVYSFATGCGSAATGNYSTVFGAGATAKAGGAQAFGVSALASGRASVAMGVGSEASGQSTVAIGGLATALSQDSIAIGTRARAEKNFAIALGTDAEAKGSGSIAIGGRRSDRTEQADPSRKVTAEGENAIAIGSHTYAKTEDSVAIGANAQVLVFDGVAVGGGSISDREKGTVGYDPYLDGDSTETNMAWKSTTGAFSVGEVGGRGRGTLTRQITGVAAGSQDTDAVNVAQLKAMKDLITGAGGGWKISVNNTDSTDVNPGSTVDFSVKNDNLKIEKEDKNKIKFALSDTLKLTSVTTGKSTLSDDGLMIEGGPRITIDGLEFGDDSKPSITIEGIDAGNAKITGVADATDNDDAVNYKQLLDVKTLATQGWKISVDDKNLADVTPGSIVDFTVGSTELGKDNLRVKKHDGENTQQVEFFLSDNLKLSSVTTGRSIMNDNGFKIQDGPQITLDGIDAGDKKIINVAEGTEDTDAVNYKQLMEVRDASKTSWQLSVNGGDATAIGQNGIVNLQSDDKNIKITKDNNHNVKFDLAKNISVDSVTVANNSFDSSGLIIEGGPRITIDGINASNKKITNVADATDNNDAVNYKQLLDVKTLATQGWRLSVDGNNATDVKAGTTVDIVAGANEDSHKNINISKNNNKITFSLNDNLKLTSVTTGGSIMSDDGFGFEDNKGPRVAFDGIDAGNERIRKVKAGTEDTDAVNYKQLQAMKDSLKTGWKISVNGENITDVSAGSVVDFAGADMKDYDNKNIQIVKKDNKVEFDLNDFIVVKRVEAGKTQLSELGFVITGGPRMTMTGIFAGNKEIYGVAAGIKDTDAVNVKQLNDVKGLISKAGGWKISVDDEDQTDVAPGSTVDFSVQYANEAGKDNLTIEKINEDDQNKIKFALSDTLELTSVTTGRSIMNDNGFKIQDGPQITIEGIDAGGKQIINVADGVEDNDAVNKKQLDGVIVDINDKINNVNAFAVLYDKNKNGSVNYGSVTLGGDNHKEPVALHNVEDGEISDKSHDAINGSQIEKISQDVAKYFGGGTKFENGKFVNPRYNLSTIDSNSKVKQKEYNDVGSALEGLDTNIKNVNHHFVNALNDIASYFGGGAGYDEEGEWHAPIFKVIQFNANGAIKKPYDNVADAFEGVNDTFSAIHNQITNITENSLVKQDGEEGLITVGKETGGTKISIANKNGDARTISGVKDGTLSKASTEAVNGSQLFNIAQNITNGLITIAQNTSKYFGGSTDVLEGIEPAFLIQGTTYDNVTDAFTGVNISINRIDNKISDVIKNSLVKQDGGVNSPITIGKDTAGTEINIAGSGKAARSISGVKAAENGDEAVNKDQLDKSIDKISKDIETASAAAVLYDKNANGDINYGSVTLGGNKGNNGPVALLNVKDGKIAQNSYDAINGGQINKISQNIANYFGGGTKFENGAFVGPQYSLSVIVEDGQVAKTTYRDVGSALKGLDANVQSVNTRVTNISNEFDQKIDGITKDALLWDDEEQAFVARHEKDGQKTNSKLKYLLDGDISEGSTDAITGNQLYLMSTQLANYFGGGAKYENGKWTAPNFVISQVNADGTIGEKKYDNVADAFGGINGGMVNINNRINDVINKVDSDALKWNKDKGAYDASHGGKPSKIINVADGRIAEDSKDAVNGGQLWQTNERINGVEKDIKHIENRVDNISTTVTNIGETVHNIDIKVDKIDNKVNDLVDGVVLYDRDENGKKVNKITLIGANESDPVTIDNVANGKIETGSKEAVNGGQLHDYTQEQMKIILDESKHYTDQRVNNIVIDAIDDAVERANNYTNMKFEALNYSIENVRKEAKQAAAIGLAVSNLRYNDTPGKLSVAFGSGLWRGQSAFALGAGYSSEDGKIRSNLSATSSGGHWGVGLGLNLTLN